MNYRMLLVIGMVLQLGATALGAKKLVTTITLERPDVETRTWSTYVPGSPAKTSCDTSGTVTDTGPVTSSVDSTTTCTTTPGRPAQWVPSEAQTVFVRATIHWSDLEQHVRLSCATGGFHRCTTFQPGTYNVEVEVKGKEAKVTSLRVMGINLDNGKPIKTKYRVIEGW